VCVARRVRRAAQGIGAAESRQAKGEDMRRSTLLLAALAAFAGGDPASEYVMRPTRPRDDETPPPAPRVKPQPVHRDGAWAGDDVKPATESRQMRRARERREAKKGTEMTTPIRTYGSQKGTT